MKKRPLTLAILATALCFHLVFSQIASYADIFEYLAKEDSNFKWEKVWEGELPTGAKFYEIKLTSQTWMDIVWEHSLKLIKPPEFENPSLALILITGSGSGKEELLYGAEMAANTGSLIALLHDVPNQPLFDGLKEDGLISYTFQKFIETENNDLPLLFPMTKSAVKAMDAIQQFAKQELGIDVSGFTVGGASKRGWTAWFSAAVDKRIKAIFPMVYDNLWLSKQMKHQIEVWGKYSEQIWDYTEKNLPQILETEAGNQLGSLVDPFTYNYKISVPKFIIIGTNDRYWPLDALNIYYDELIGEKYIYYAPNSGHGLENNLTQVISNAVAFHLKTAGKLKFPKFSWQCQKNGDLIEFAIIPDPKVKPEGVFIWIATSKTRDFRDVIWQKKAVTSLNNSRYVYQTKKPDEGYFALFGETGYQQDGKKFYLSTNVYIY
jgi:PhoPQ-activated pathogenicity-related protein